MEKKTIEFTEDREVEAADGHVIASFKIGQQYTLPASSADRWVRRGVAFYAKTKPSEEAGSDAPANAEEAKVDKTKQRSK